MSFKLKPFKHTYKLPKGEIIRSLLSFSLKLIGWLLPKGSSQFLLKLHSFATVLVNINKHRGVRGVVEYLKDTRLALLIYLAREWPLKKVPGVKVDNEGFPLDLSPMKEEIVLCTLPGATKQQMLLLRGLLTLLFSTRALSKGTIPDTSSITQPFDGSEEFWGDHRSSFWKALGLPKKFTKAPKTTQFRKYHMTSKSGPNGQALITAIADLVLINRDPRLMEAICEVGGSLLTTRIQTLSSQLAFLVSRYPRYPSQSLRKLTWFSDKEMKVRVVAILDYFSQCALFPLHSWLYRILRRIPQDCTFNQGSFRGKIEGWTEFYSIDLSNATDRFPIRFIAYLLKGILPDKWVDSWCYIMVGLPFDFRKGNEAFKLRYSVGTPMGAYTSWATFAVAHHYVMYIACKLVNQDWGNAKYTLLGDDILIGDRQLAEAYKAIISCLGVKFSPIKTHESKTLLEFAKRLILNGNEITPFPVHAARSASKFYHLLPVLYGEKDKGWDFGDELAKVVSSYYEYVKGFNASTAKEFYHKSAVVEQLMLYMRGSNTAINYLKAAYRQLGTPLPQISEDLARNAIQGSLMDLFNASDPVNQKNVKGKPLGVLAEMLVMNLTNTEDEEKVIWACDAISMIPVLNVYGQITEMYLRLKKQGVDTLWSSGHWPLFLKSIGLPMSDSVFVERQRDRLARGASQAAFKLSERVKQVLERRKQVREKGSWSSFFFDDEDAPATYLSKTLK